MGWLKQVHFKKYQDWNCIYQDNLFIIILSIMINKMLIFFKIVCLAFNTLIFSLVEAPLKLLTWSWNVLFILMSSMSSNLYLKMNFQFRKQEKSFRCWGVWSYWLCYTYTIPCLTKNWKSKSIETVDQKVMRIGSSCLDICTYMHFII